MWESVLKELPRKLNLQSEDGKSSFSRTHGERVMVKLSKDSGNWTSDTSEYESVNSSSDDGNSVDDNFTFRNDKECNRGRFTDKVNFSLDESSSFVIVAGSCEHSVKVLSRMQSSSSEDKWHKFGNERNWESANMSSFNLGKPINSNVFGQRRVFSSDKWESPAIALKLADECPIGQSSTRRLCNESGNFNLEIVWRCGSRANANDSREGKQEKSMFSKVSIVGLTNDNVRIVGGRTNEKSGLFWNNSKYSNPANPDKSRNCILWW